MNEFERKRINNLIWMICIVFITLLTYISYLQVFKSSKFAQHPFNRRKYMIEEKITRGTFYDRNGTVLAKSEFVDEKQERVYPFKNLYSHVIGYNSKIYGNSLLESSLNEQLLNFKDNQRRLATLSSKYSYPTLKGNDVHLTIDNDLQMFSNRLMKSKKGAVIALNPSTGEVLAMVSKPDFNPDGKYLKENWESLVEGDDAVLVPRALQGLYPPGSVFKVITAAGGVEKGLDSKIFRDQGKIIINGQEIRNAGSKAYGDIDLAKALEVSSNVVLSQIGLEIGAEYIKELCERFMINKALPFELNISTGRLSYKNMDINDIAAVSIGQGRLVVTPFHMAMAASAIANDGIMQKPFIVSKITNSEGESISTTRVENLARVMSKEVADKIEDMMERCVKYGTGKKAFIPNIRVAGKTGTAQNEKSLMKKGGEHAWFIAFAPAENPKIALCVLLENEGQSGGAAAAPIAREIIEYYLNKK